MLSGVYSCILAYIKRYECLYFHVYTKIYMVKYKGKIPPVICHEGPKEGRGIALLFL